MCSEMDSTFHAFYGRQQKIGMFYKNRLSVIGDARYEKERAWVLVSEQLRHCQYLMAGPRGSCPTVFVSKDFFDYSVVIRRAGALCSCHLFLVEIVVVSQGLFPPNEISPKSLVLGIRRDIRLADNVTVRGA